jgi:hypothetical protein
MAREVRLDPRYREPSLLGCAPFLLGVALLVSGPMSPRGWPEARVTSGAVIIFAWFLYQILQSFKRFRCPQCGDRLKKGIYINVRKPGDRDDGGPIHYVCPRCDIEWDTGHEWSDRGD